MKEEFRLGIGKRIVKTGISVLITATLCEWLNWPAIFAVIAAIVTIEPSIHSSLRKGFVRFPAAAIGAAFAMITDSLLGPSPLAFALSAVFTIYMCQLFRWHDGMIVAALTAVNMITLTEAYFLENFLIRLGTTSLGLAVSILINFLVFPPRFDKEIESNFTGMLQETSELLNESLSLQLTEYTAIKKKSIETRLVQLKQNLHKTLGLITFQLDDYRYGRSSKAYMKKILRLRKRIQVLQQMCPHIDNLLSSSPIDHLQTDEKQIIWGVWEGLNSLLKSLYSLNQLQIHPIDDRLQLMQKHFISDLSIHPTKRSCITAFELLALHRIINGSLRK